MNLWRKMLFELSELVVLKTCRCAQRLNNATWQFELSVMHRNIGSLKFLSICSIGATDANGLFPIIFNRSVHSTSAATVSVSLYLLFSRLAQCGYCGKQLFCSIWERVIKKNV